MKTSDISVVIPIKEDSKNLRELLSNLTDHGLTNVHVVDSVVSQNKDICADFNVRYVVFEWDGGFPKKRNWYLDKARLHDWVLFLDSDERLTDQFCNELLEFEPDDAVFAVQVSYENVFLGSVLRHGDVMTKIPLMRSHVRFEKIEENGWSKFDMEIHEHPDVDARNLSSFKNQIVHLERTSIDKYISKHNEYSNWEARRASEWSSRPKSLRLYLKRKLLGSRLAGPFYFLYAFVWKLGFLDGKAGLVLARLKAQYFYWIYLKTRYESQ